MYDEVGNGDLGSLCWWTDACGFGHWSDHWGRPIGGSQLDTGCCVADYNWSGTALLYVCCIHPHLPTGNVYVTREPEVVQQPSVINHAKERTWSLSWYSGDQLWQLMELNALCGRNALVQFLQHVANTNENQTGCNCDECVWGKFFDLGAGGDDYLYESKLWSHDRIYNQALDELWTSEDGDVKIVFVKFSDAHDWNTKWNQQRWIRVVRTSRETRGIEHMSRMRRVSSQPSLIGIVTKPRVTMKEQPQ